LRRALWACALVIAVSALSLLPYAGNSAELVRMRNALLIDFVQTSRFDWTPSTMPADFAVERALPSPQFSARVQALQLQQLPSDWERALALARHLLENRRQLGQPIQSDLEKTYAAIRADGSGYCADYSDVYAALALAAGLQVRAWAFSFEGFGGRGHVFNEIWDAQASRWRMIDAFSGLYPVDDAGQPMSALEFRKLLLGGAQVRMVEIDPKAAPVFWVEGRAQEYYMRGIHQWYLWWGNGVYTYDNALLVRALGPLSRSLEQLGAIVQRVHPRIRILAEPENQALVERMQRLRLHLMVLLVASVAAVLATAGLLLAHRQARRRAAAARPVAVSTGNR
jgi:hypothetical protein